MVPRPLFDTISRQLLYYNDMWSTRESSWQHKNVWYWTMVVTVVTSTHGEVWWDHISIPDRFTERSMAKQCQLCEHCLILWTVEILNWTLGLLVEVRTSQKEQRPNELLDCLWVWQALYVGCGKHCMWGVASTACGVGPALHVGCGKHHEYPR